MRQLPANSGGATSTTENSRSRSQQANESAGVTTLSNGSVKEPIVTRSKSRLRVGRRLSGRSPKKPDTPQKANDTYHHEGTQRRKPDRGASTTTTSSGQSSPSSSSPKNDSNHSDRSTEKVYARHYKSYRRLNGIKSRRGDAASMTENHSRTQGKRVDEDSMDDSRTYENRGSVVKSRLRGNRSSSARNPVAHQNGTSSPSSPKGTRSSSSRVRRLMLRRKKQLSRRKESSELSSGSSSPQSSPKNGKVDLSQRKDRAGKRRSALWVLNCEAESFLFGETAADKHEVELPPITPPSPPPKKQRKWRVTELAHLLEKSPILESKLRKSSSSESGSDMQRDVVRMEPNARTPRRVRTSKRREKTPDMCSTSTSSKSVKGRSNHEPPVLSPPPQPPQPELLSPIPFLYSPDSAADHEAKTVQFQQMLANVNYRYSFEDPPSSESWYDAFSRTESSVIPYTFFFDPVEERNLLPYEMDRLPLRRSRTKLERNSRKSPRCHASTLAILSSERPTRSTRSSVTLDSSPTPTINNLQSESTLSALLISPPPPPPTPHTSSTTTTPAATASTSSSVTTTTTTTPTRVSPPKCIPNNTTTPRRRNPSSPKVNHHQSELKTLTKTKSEISAAEYLWDSVQLLSDPYVLNLLNGEDPDAVPETISEHSKNSNNNKGFIKNHRCNNNINNNNNYVINNCPVKHMVRNLETSERKASLRSGDTSSSSTTTSSNSNSHVVGNSRLASLPKCSSRNHSHGTNHVGGSPPVSPSFATNERVAVNGVSRRFTSRSPPISPTSRVTNCHAARLSSKNSKGTNAKQSKSLKGSGGGSEGDNGLISYEKSSKKSPIVLVTDICSATTKTRINSWEEESLFIGDGLPPLPSWPV